MHPSTQENPSMHRAGRRETLLSSRAPAEHAEVRGDPLSWNRRRWPLMSKDAVKTVPSCQSLLFPTKAGDRDIASGYCVAAKV